MPRKIEKEIYKFSELSPKAKEKAISWYRDGQEDLAYIVQDDDYLLEPSHKDLIKLFGDDFYEKLNKNNKYKDTPLVENTRKIYFDTGGNRHLDFTEGIKINNDNYFLKYLGIPEAMIQKVYYTIYSEGGRYPDSKIRFEENDSDYEFTPEEWKILEKAEDKFDDYREEILGRIISSIDQMESDEYISNEIEINDYEFYEDGSKYSKGGIIPYLNEKLSFPELFRKTL